MLGFSGSFRGAGIVQDLHGGGGPKGFPILEHPDHLFIRGDFDKLRAFPIFYRARVKIVLPLASRVTLCEAEVRR